jgi:cytochrome c biogenesis protein CcmG, thiol:disulfide interchange protein DsbE
MLGKRNSESVNKLVMMACIIFLSFQLRAQSPLLSAQIKTIRGAMIPFSSAIQKDSLILVCFWATESDPSIAELNAINAKFEKWKQSLSFRLMAVSVDESRTASRVKGLINANEWKFDVYTDINGELRKALNSSILNHKK